MSPDLGLTLRARPFCPQTELARLHFPGLLRAFTAIVVARGTHTNLHSMMAVLSTNPLYGRFVRARSQAAIDAWTTLHASYQPLLRNSLEMSRNLRLCTATDQRDRL